MSIEPIIIVTFSLILCIILMDSFIIEQVTDRTFVYAVVLSSAKNIVLM